jgi:hypothetical protein
MIDKPSCPRFPCFCLCDACKAYHRAVWNAEEGTPQLPQIRGQINRWHELLRELQCGQWLVPRDFPDAFSRSWHAKYLPLLVAKGWAEKRIRAGARRNLEYHITDEGRVELERSKVSV